MAWDAPQGKAPLPNFRDWVPDGMRIALYLFFLFTFQFCNGMYFTAFEDMKGGLSITPADVSMMGQTVLIGLTFYFPLAFRLKFRFPNKWNLVFAASLQILCNLLFPHLESMPLRMLVCYLGGFCRLYGTFECFSNLLPRITPTYNYAVFLSFVFFIVLGCINVFDWMQVQIIYRFGWKMLHLASCGLLLTTVLLELLTMKSFRAAPKMKLYGINWLGMLTWSIFILSLIFIFTYGEQLGWFHSAYIKGAAAMACFSLAYGIWGMYHLRHPFIDRQAFLLPHFWTIMGIFLLLDILLSAQTVLQNTFCTAVMGMDRLALADLKWLDFAGQALGALFCWQMLVRKLITPKWMTCIGLGAIVAYMIMMFALMAPGTDVAHLALPLILCGFGHVTIFIVLTTYVQATANFIFYFQMICLLGFIRTGVGAPIGDALLERGMHALLPYNGLLDTLRQLYGLEILIGILALTVLLCTHLSRQISNPVPRIRNIWQSVAEYTDKIALHRKLAGKK